MRDESDTPEVIEAAAPAEAPAVVKKPRPKAEKKPKAEAKPKAEKPAAKKPAPKKAVAKKEAAPAEKPAKKKRLTVPEGSPEVGTKVKFTAKNGETIRGVVSNYEVRVNGAWAIVTPLKPITAECRPSQLTVIRER